MRAPARLSRVRRVLLASLAAATAIACTPHQAAAQLGRLAKAGGGSGSTSNSAPVTFQADNVSYDKDRALITATGHVVAWQNGDVLMADKVTFDRNTDVAAAYGHVSLTQPDGEVLFARYAELTQGMKQGVLEGMRALLTQNARLAANGARRYEGKVNDLSRAVYTACNVCAQHPDQAPFWQLRAYDATQDLEHKRIDYRDMYLDMLGVPVFYFPYFSMPDPSVKRQTGFLIPDVAFTDDYLGSYVTIPYYYVIGPSSDVTLTPLLATKSGPQLTTEYRRDFNNGVIRITGAVAYDSSTSTKGSNIVATDDTALNSPEGYLFAHARFIWNDDWDYGADLNVATSANYLRDYRIPGYGADVLGSTAYIDGYGVDSYTRIDTLFFQGLNATEVNDSVLPYVLPRYTYDLLAPTDPLGGRLRVDTEDFVVYRPVGTSDQRASLVMNWDRDAPGPFGTRWTLTGNLQSEAYNAGRLNLIPNYESINEAASVQALPTAALRVSWPFVRLGQHGASQTIEPIAQVIAAPQTGNSINDNIPNEDSLDYTFSDTTLFALNRYDGIDRQDGGVRANIGVHGNWTFRNGMYLDGLIGESVRDHVDQNMMPGTGLAGHASDVLTRVSFVPSSWLDVVVRNRFDHTNGDVTFADGIVSTGVKLFRVGLGYIYSSTNPYYYYDNDYRIPAQISPGFYLPRNEISVNASSHFGHWGVSGLVQENLSNQQYTGYTGITHGAKLVALGGDVSWSNECFSVNVNYSDRFTFINGDNGDRTILLTFTFKTLGAIGVNG